MTRFELSLAIAEVSDAAMLALHEGRDVASASYLGLTVVTGAADGETALAAARVLTASLEEVSGVTVVGCCHDLVSLEDIASRASVSEDRLMEWLGGEVFPGRPFPSAFNLVAGGVWLWGEVHAWLRATGQSSDPVEFPSYEDHLAIDGWLAQRRAALLS